MDRLKTCPTGHKTMKDLFKWISWLSLVAIGVIAILCALIAESVGVAIACGIVSAIVWVAWGAFLFYLFGLRRRIQRHLGYSLKSATFLDKEVGITRINDVREALESLYGDKSTPTNRYGVKMSMHQASIGFLQDGNSEVAPLKWTTLETQPGEFRHYPTNAVYFLYCDEIPFVACLSSPHESNSWEFEEEYEGGYVGKRGDCLQVFARNLDESAKVLNFIMTEASVQSIYRGKMLHVSPRGRNLPGQLVRVTELPDTRRGNIVLPDEVLEVIHRAVLARLKHARLLEHHGHSSKTGILLHGMPGTGKTLVSKYLINLCQNHTAIVPTGMDTETIREAFRLAVYLQPAIIVIEDVDLLAERRETNANVTGLQELMNELDGLAPSTDAIILMSTNRPEIIEPALAARPGRVSQAVFFPLPSPALREQLLRLFTELANTEELDIARWVERTHNASPAFLEELVKRAIIIAAERMDVERSNVTVALLDEDFDQAIHELVVFGGDLTSNMLGFSENP